MFVNTAVLFTIFAFAANVAAQNNNTPPACMIAAVNTQKDPSQVKSICQTQDVSDYINKNCGNNRDAAMTYFATVCKGVNVQVSTSTTNASSSGTGSELASQTGTPSSSGSPSSSNSGSSTASSSPARGAGAPMARLGMDVVGLAALGAFGAMLAM